MDLGSDVLWASLFEGGTFDEWTSIAGGSANAFPSPNTIAVSNAYAHHGRYAAVLTIDAGSASGSAPNRKSAGSK